MSASPQPKHILLIENLHLTPTPPPPHMPPYTDTQQASTPTPTPTPTDLRPTATPTPTDSNAHTHTHTHTQTHTPACGAAVHHLVKVQLALCSLLDALLHSAFTDEAVHVHWLVLPDAVHACHGLRRRSITEASHATHALKRWKMMIRYIYDRPKLIMNTVGDCNLVVSCRKYPICTVYIYIYIWLWPTLGIIM
jgi:hypothetical protein